MVTVLEMVARGSARFSTDMTGFRKAAAPVALKKLRDARSIVETELSVRPFPQRALAVRHQPRRHHACASKMWSVIPQQARKAARATIRKGKRSPISPIASKAAPASSSA